MHLNKEKLVRGLLQFQLPRLTRESGIRSPRYIFEKCLLALSQQRWRGSEPDPNLTWGRIFEGDSFIDGVQMHYTFRPDHHVCEIGPGYGRLLETIVERRLPFRAYSGIELSAERVRKLNAKFDDPRIRFFQGDANNLRLQEEADLAICSSTLEHLFPDCAKALKNLSCQLKAEAAIAVDFIQQDSEMKLRDQAFEAQTQAFVRIYSAEEIKELFAACGLTAVTIQSIVLGLAPAGEIRRIFVSGTRGSHPD
jgi:phospholipid N-methyltransferase